MVFRYFSKSTPDQKMSSNEEVPQQVQKDASGNILSPQPVASVKVPFVEESLHNETAARTSQQQDYQRSRSVDRKELLIKKEAKLLKNLEKDRPFILKRAGVFLWNSPVSNLVVKVLFHLLLAYAIVTYLGSMFPEFLKEFVLVKRT